jgi:steroid delta-isomerase-like uncharacterized protein
MAMSIRDIEQLDDLGIKAWDTHDSAAFAALFADKFTLTADNVPEPMKTMEALRSYSEAWFTAFPDMHVKVTNRIVTEDGVGAEIEFSGTNTGPMVMGGMEMPPTNKKVNSNATYFAKVRNGKITEFHAHPNLASVMMQLGMMPPAQ